VIEIESLILSKEHSLRVNETADLSTGTVVTSAYLYPYPFQFFGVEVIEGLVGSAQKSIGRRPDVTGRQQKHWCYTLFALLGDSLYLKLIIYKRMK
jgi:hypothetical protein